MAGAPQAAEADTPEKLQLWAAYHDGQVQAQWREQWLQNTRTLKLIDTLGNRVGAMERRVFMFAGAGALAGVILPWVINELLGRNGG